MKSIWLSGFLLTLLALLLALTPVSSSLAAPPEFSFVDFSVTFPIVGCDFPVQGELSATFKTSVHYDGNGDLRMLIDRVQDQQTSYTNLATGNSISSTKGAGIDQIRMQNDGTIIFMIAGLVDIVRVPGLGLVVQDVGRIVVDSVTGELLFSAGQFTIHGPGGSIEALCAALE